MSFSNDLLGEFWFEDLEDEGALREASHSFAAKLAEVDGLKTFPVVAREILSLLSAPDFKFDAVARALESDPSLAAGVMRMANSAFFSHAKKISSIQQALVRLGGRTVREVVAAVASMDLFPDSDGIGKQIRDHCASVAAIAQNLAIVVAKDTVEGIFLCGLMHDIGKMLLLESRESDYSPDVLKADKTHLEERDFLGYDHAVLGAHVLHQWNIPDPVPLVVAWHHRPKKAYADPNHARTVAVLRLADQLDRLLTSSFEDARPKCELMVEAEDAKTVNLTIDTLESIWDDLTEARSDALKLFAG